MKDNAQNRLVYSSETGRVQPEKKKQGKNAIRPESDGSIRLRREVKGRGGGMVIVISGIPLDDAPLKELASFLKKRCGCGGSVKSGNIEIQGDHRDLLLTELQDRGYRVKLSGG